MKTVFTGSSSFTGYRFIKELVTAGHEVIATFKGGPQDYSGIRKKRVDEINNICRCEFECEFGSEKFLSLLDKTSQIDLLCHHYADVTNYKSPDFDVISAANNNTKNIRLILQMLKGKNCNKILITGSYFERNEGAGSDDLKAFSPYGLSKGLTSEMFGYYTAAMGMKLGKFVIPNPFGPYEEPRFTSYLIKSWIGGKVPSVTSSLYVRDNIHVWLLAKAYAWFAGCLNDAPGFQKLNPSGYPESQGSFAKRFAEEMHPRLEIPCELILPEQKEFPEPLVRINTDVVARLFDDWDEKQAWDELAEYYTAHFNPKRRIEQNNGTK
jgi:UDP-glucose 4-epimerase